MSGSGTNIMRLLEHEKALGEQDGRSPFETVFIFSDRADAVCAGEKIALENGLPYFSHDIRMFHARNAIKRTVSNEKGLAARRAYDRVAETLVKAFHIDVVALGGYMSYITLGRCVNVHPADLSLLDSDGNRKYVGDQAVHDAIYAGERVLRSSTLWTDDGVDTGPLLMVSDPVTVALPEPLETLMKDRDDLIGSRIITRSNSRNRGTGKYFHAPSSSLPGGAFLLTRGGGSTWMGASSPRGAGNKKIQLRTGPIPKVPSING